MSENSGDFNETDRIELRKSTSDHAIAAVKAAVSAVPVFGGAIANLIGDYVPSSTEKSIEKALNLLNERLRRLGERLDPEAVDKDEFAELFKSSYLLIVRTHQDAKLRGAANLLANLLLKEGDSQKLDYTELDHFFRSLDSLSGGAIGVLGHAYKLATASPSQDPFSESISLNFANLQEQWPEMDPSLLMGLVGELNSVNLLHLLGSPGARTADYANYPIELTPMGARFVKHILELSDQD